MLSLHAARLVLPVRPAAAGDETAFEAPQAAPAWRTEPIRPPCSERRVERDERTGLVTLSILEDGGELRDLEHGLVSGEVTRERWSIRPGDPLSARVETHWTQRRSRDAWSVRTETFSTMTASAEAFHLAARIEAYEGERLVFERKFDQRVARDNL